MRKTGTLAATVIVVGAMSGPAFAQATERLLATSEAPPTVVARPARTTKNKKITHRDTGRAARDVLAEDASPRRDIAVPSSRTKSDPLSFGMKWNGSSDNARETRVQNYNAGASGSGAEVGMKLHF